jgi:hypothetical protein
MYHIGEVFVIGGIGLGKYDLPQRCKVRGLKSMTADCGCPQCCCPKPQYHDWSGTADHGHKTDRFLADVRHVASQEPTAKLETAKLKEAGLPSLKDGRPDWFRDCNDGNGIRTDASVSNPPEVTHAPAGCYKAEQG